MQITPVPYDIQIKRNEGEIEDLMFSVFEIEALKDIDRNTLRASAQIIGQHLLVKFDDLIQLKLSKVPNDVLQFISLSEQAMFLEVTPLGPVLYDVSIV